MAPSQYARVPAVILVLASLMLLAGCIKSGKEPELLKGMDLPSAGENLPDGFWDVVSQDDTDKPLLASRNVSWPFPLFSAYVSEFGVDRTRDRVNTFKAGWNDTLFPFVSFPLRINVSEYSYGRPALEPVGRKGFSWNPFWVTSWNEGTSYSDMNYVGKGFPLFWSQVGLTSHDEQDTVRVNATLWTLGPFWATAKSTDGGKALEMPGLKKAYFSAPLFVGGLGALVWSDYIRRDVDGDYGVHHGPFLGWLGYRSSRSTKRTPPKAEGEAPVEFIQSRRHVLGGILWQDRSRRTMEGEVYNSGHGPLWGMFGWGEVNNTKTIQFLWMPIKIGGGEKAPAES